jgi:peptide chain release factor 2
LPNWKNPSKAWKPLFWKPGGGFDPEGKQLEIHRLERITASPAFWENREEAEITLGQLSRIKNQYYPWKALRHDLEDLRTLYELAKEAGDESLVPEIAGTLGGLKETFAKLRLQDWLSEPEDRADAFVTIHSGAGGTEACDWANMLYRMYSRWAERRGCRTEIMDILEAEGGIKSVTLLISGEFCRGYLKGETGIHRLVRISPFDASARRHTSFASVYVSPAIDDTIEVDIKSDDLKIDTYRSSGAGGQHVNKTDSAVRITHLPTGIVVQCQNERSQYKNKANAMKVLRSRLYEYYKVEQEKEKEKNSQEKKDISWGNQIRSYVFQPYTLVKDHRTKAEAGNIQAVMDGGIDLFIEEYLKWQQEKRS